MRYHIDKKLILSGLQRVSAIVLALSGLYLNLQLYFSSMGLNCFNLQLLFLLLKG